MRFDLKPVEQQGGQSGLAVLFSIQSGEWGAAGREGERPDGFVTKQYWLHMGTDQQLNLFELLHHNF